MPNYSELVATLERMTAVERVQFLVLISDMIDRDIRRTAQALGFNGDTNVLSGPLWNGSETGQLPVVPAARG